MSDVYHKIYEAVAQIPAGKVATYGTIAKMVGTSPRVVGNALHRNPDPATIYCHRIVNSHGQLAEHFAFGGLAGQQERLRQEGLIVDDNRIDLDTYGWQPRP